jgi:hypothetical protein
MRLSTGNGKIERSAAEAKQLAISQSCPATKALIAFSIKARALTQIHQPKCAILKGMSMFFCDRCFASGPNCCCATPRHKTNKQPATARGNKKLRIEVTKSWPEAPSTSAPLNGYFKSGPDKWNYNLMLTCASSFNFSLSKKSRIAQGWLENLFMFAPGKQEMSELSAKVELASVPTCSLRLLNARRARRLTAGPRRRHQ